MAIWCQYEVNLKLNANDELMKDPYGIWIMKKAFINVKSNHTVELKDGHHKLVVYWIWMVIRCNWDVQSHQKKSNWTLC